MTAELYADTVGRIDFVAGMIRIELVSLEPGEEGKQPRLETRQRVVMPLEGFLGALKTMGDLADKLVEGGQLRRGEPGKPGTRPAAEPA